MATLLKVDEWQSPTGHWYVADVHTWASWRNIAEVLDIDTLEEYISVLTEQYHALVVDVCEYIDKPELIIYKWSKADYRFAHQFKLDVNRIARKKNYLIG